MNLESKDGRAIANRLRQHGESKALALAGRFLDDPTTGPIPDHATTRTVKAGELLKVWNSRIRFAESEGRRFHGAKGLIEKLTGLQPSTELVLYYLKNNLKTVGLFYFEAISDKFVGLILTNAPAPSTDSITGD